MKVEVKSVAYLQSWFQKKYSKIQFNIALSSAWDANIGKLEKEKKRHSDVYVFCLLKHKNKATIDPLDVGQWEFYILATAVLDKELGNQKQVSLSQLKKLNPVRVSFGEMNRAIDTLSFSLKE